MPKKLLEKETHKIEFSKPDGFSVKQGAIGKKDLYDIIRSVLKDGYTRIIIEVIK